MKNKEFLQLVRRLCESVTTQPIGYGQYEATGVDLGLVHEVEAYLDKVAPKPAPQKTWRDEKPTEKQLHALRKFKVDVEPKTRGEASEMLDGLVYGARQSRACMFDEEDGQPRSFGDL